jgi:ATP-dependent Clp protease ATP-binding subunit ClpA
MMSKELESILKRAQELAQTRKEPFYSIEHLTLASMEDPWIQKLVDDFGGDLNTIKKQLLQFLDKHKETLGRAAGAEATGAPQATIGVQQLLYNLEVRAEHSSISQILPAHLIIEILGETKSHGSFYLRKQGLKKIAVIRYFSQEQYGIKESDSSNAHDLPPEEPTSSENEAKKMDSKKSTQESVLNRYTTNLSELARLGKLDPVVGREKEVHRLLEIIHRRTKNNPILVGEPGVGKTVIAHALAQSLAKPQAGQRFHTVLSLDVGALLAGAKYRGEFEDRLKAVMGATQKMPGTVLFIDEIHTIIGAGATGASSLDAANLIKPALQEGGLCCLGSTTQKEFRQIFEKDKALARRFQKVEVSEPTSEQCIEILMGLKGKYEEFHKVTYSVAVLESIVQLSNRFLTGKHQPDKSIDIMDEMGASARLQSNQSPSPQDEAIELTVAQAEALVAKSAGVPTTTVKKEDKEILKTLSEKLRSEIFGQDHVIESVVQHLIVARSGLGNESKPWGSFLFCGPTGVGKTELTKQLSLKLSARLLRFDMSEYMEKHAVSRFTGAPPGYIGYAEGGLLTEAAAKNPHCVFLFDEIEKAHPDIHHILLQVMDYGKLTDSQGKEADFRQCILVLTSNLGARELAGGGFGFAPAAVSLGGLSAIKEGFTPEFMNRLDGVYTFNPLQKEGARLVLDKCITMLSQQLKSKNVELIWTDEALNFLLEQGFNSSMGARPMERAVAKFVKEPLARELLFGKWGDGGKINVVLKEGSLFFQNLTAGK